MDRATAASQLDGSSPQSPTAVVRVALIGNPNTGKTSLFNALTGFRRHVANYPGVTVEVARGAIRGTARPMELIDLPGTYSLAATSPDEALVTDTLCGRGRGTPPPDLILAIVDASNLPRNLYLLSQVLELGRPTIVALNMVDVAESRGLKIDAERLSRRLGVPVVPVVATWPATVARLVEALGATPPSPCDAIRPRLPEALRAEAAQLVADQSCAVHPAEAVRTLLYEGGHAEQAYRGCGGAAERLTAARGRLKAAGIEGPALEVRIRYAWINEVLDGVITRPLGPVTTWSDRLDRILTHRIGGAVVLFSVLYAVFMAIFSGAEPLMGWIEGACGALGDWVGPLLPEGVARSLVVDGVVAGVGGVLVFLPQIMILFAFIAVLEDCGYLARAAYMMDRLMRGVGLSGRAFIPLLSAFACAVPAIMGTRAIADRRERFLTIMLAPYMSCAARLPVYILLIAAFVPATGYLGGWLQLQALVMLAMYLVGVVVAVPLAWVMKRTLLAGPAGGFVLELPSYKVPRLRAVWQRMYDGGRSFVVRAGTIILIVNVLMWALAYFPRSTATRDAVLARAAAAGWDDETTDSELAGAHLRSSYLGRMGHAIEPVLAPLDWDWKIGVAVIASFPAREVIVATLGTLFNLGGEQDEESEALQTALQRATRDDGRPLFTLPVALSIMVFFALCAQCVSTLVVIGRETGSWGYPVLSFVSMTLIAYGAAWAVGAVARLWV